MPGFYIDRTGDTKGAIGSSGFHVLDAWANNFHGNLNGNVTGDVTGDLNGRWLNASGTGDHYTPIFITGDGPGQTIGVPAKCSAKFVYSVDVDGNRSDKQYKICMDGVIGTASGVIYCL